MIRLAVAIVGLGLAACQAEPSVAPSPAPSRTPAPAASPPAPPAVTTLAGEWRVAGIDGRALDEPYGLALRGSADELWWEPRCAFFIRAYQLDGGAIRFGPDRITAARKPGEPTPPVCTIAPPPRMADVIRALDAAESVARTAQNGILISGGGRSLLLFSQ